MNRQKYAGFALTRFAKTVHNYYIKGDTPMSIKTDLAKEIFDKISPDYPKKRSFLFGKTEISEILIETKADSEIFGKPLGKYVTVEADFPRKPFENFYEEANAVAFELRKMLPRGGTVLAVGLGNSFLTADSLGPLTAEKLCCGEFFGRKLCSVTAGVFGRTAVEPRLLIAALTKALSPDAVLLIDSLAAENIDCVCRSVQLCDSGLSPGSGLSAEKHPISKETLGVPVVAIGTPTVTRISSDSVFVSPNDIDILVKRCAKLLSLAICLAVFPEEESEFIKGIMI